MLKHLALASLVPLSFAGAHVATALSAAESPCASGSVSVAVSGPVPFGTAEARADGHAAASTCPSGDPGGEEPPGDPAEEGSSEEPSEQGSTEEPAEEPAEEGDESSADEPAEEGPEGSAEEPADDGSQGSAEPAVTIDADITLHASASELVDDARSRERDVEDQVQQSVSDTCERAASESERDREASVEQGSAPVDAVRVHAGSEVRVAGDTTIEQACPASS